MEQFVRWLLLPGERLPPEGGCPWDLPAVRGVRDAPLDLAHEVVFIVGENGSGKSTLMEGLAVALGLNPEGGSQRMACGTREPRSPLHEALRVARGARRPRSRYFLRAESFYSATLVDEIPPPLAPTAACRSTPARTASRSLALVNHRVGPKGLYLLDGPEAALSPTGLLALLRRMHDLVADGSQFIVATHAPMLMAYPRGAHLRPRRRRHRPSRLRGHRALPAHASVPRGTRSISPNAARARLTPPRRGP